MQRCKRPAIRRFAIVLRLVGSLKHLSLIKVYMEIAKLGEFGLIDRLTKDIEKKNESTIYGVGVGDFAA